MFLLGRGNKLASFPGGEIDAGSFVPVWLTGIGLGLLFDRTGSLVAPITANATFNLINVWA